MDGFTWGPMLGVPQPNYSSNFGFDPMAIMGNQQQASPTEIAQADQMRGIHSWLQGHQLNNAGIQQWQGIDPNFQGYNPSASNPHVQALINALMGR